MPVSDSYPSDPYEPTIVPRSSVVFPLRMQEPHGFDVDNLNTWPRTEGRVEYVAGALWFMPPCGDDQQYTAADVVTTLTLWCRAHPGFVVGSNEAGMKLGGEVRAADAALWRETDLSGRSGGLQRVPPVLAVEVAGRDDTIGMLRDKADWYLERGVEVVWIVEPATRRVVVVTDGEVVELDARERLPEHAELPGLTPEVADLFRQLDGM